MNTIRPFLKFPSFKTIRMSRLDSGRADTWQPSRALEWDPVSQVPSKDSQGPKISTRYKLNLPIKINKSNNLSFCQNFDRTPPTIWESPCPKKTIYNAIPSMGNHQIQGNLSWFEAGFSFSQARRSHPRRLAAPPWSDGGLRRRWRGVWGRDSSSNVFGGPPT